MNISPMFLNDFYKQSHANMYAPKTQTIYSTWTWRSSRMEGVNDVVCFGVQGFLKEFLIDYFNENFFSQDKDKALLEYDRLLSFTVGRQPENIERAASLYELGYLPLHFRSVKEGTILPIRSPMIAFWNTNGQFYWLTNFIETLLSCEIWQPMTAATIAYGYRKMLNQFADKTTGAHDFVKFQGHDFSMRGMCGWQAAAKSGAGHLLSFAGTDTIPAILYLEKYYGSNIEKELIGTSIPASEHSVAESYGDINEEEYFRHIIGEVHPNGFVSMVSDTWDFWKVITETLPRLKDIIMKRDGKLVIRPDSGDPVKIVCGDPDATEECVRKGAVRCLWEIFGGKVNDRGFKELDSHIGLIYGDAITWTRAKMICEILESNGFASSNNVFGIGSYTYQYNTRDTFGGAVKSSMAIIDGKEIPMFKNPKTDNGVKKSQKGCSVVFADGHYEDGFTLMDSINHPENVMKTVFMNGKLYNETNLGEIRERLGVW